MKKPLLLIIALIAVGLSSCKKVEDANVPITNEEAANLISNSLASSSGGVTVVSSDISLNSQALYSNATGCGVTKTDSVSHSATSGSTTFGYKIKFVSKLTCNANNQADNVSSTITYAGYYNGPKVTSTGSGTTTFVIAGLTPGSTVYAINGESKSTGSFKLKSDTTRKGTANIDIVVKNLVITKATASTPAGIASGSATAVITGTTAKNGTFSFDGSLVFNGSGSATLTLGSVVYIVNLLTGVITKQ